MKNIFIIILMISSIIFSQSALNLSVGITNSTMEAGDDIDPLGEMEYKMGYRFGLDKTLTNGLIIGTTFTQRGSSMDMSDGEFRIDTETTINYLTGFILNPLSLASSLDMLLGFEVGYFFSGKSKTKFCEYISCVTDTYTIDREDWDEGDSNFIDYGVVIGGRYRINQKFYIYGTYYLGIAQLADDADANWHGFQSYLSYRIN